jgi:AraC-like DNA-binding protein
MAQPLFDPALARLWRLLQEAPSTLKRVHVWRARDSLARREGDHLHPIPNLVLCLAGTTRVTGGTAGRIDLLPGEALVLAPCARHAHPRLRGDSAVLEFGFVGEWSDLALYDTSRQLWGRVRREPYRALLDELVARPQPTDGPRRLELARRLLRDLVGERVLPLALVQPELERMASFLWWNFDRGVTAADVLRASGLKTTRAHELFRSFFGASPKQVLLTQRLEMARHLLREGLAPRAIAETCGFHGRADFTRAFRRRFGMPPTRWTP